MSGFVTLGIRDEVVRALGELQITEPTPIQTEAIPTVLSGRDVLAQAQTGTGKTLAFLLPILEKVDPAEKSIQALIVTPTRELAIQIVTEAKKVTKFLRDVRVLPIYGGQNVEQQANQLGSIQIVAGTPGRLLDHVRRGTMKLSQVSTLVLDEADQMLQLGFLPDVEAIMREIPSSRQSLLFSATMPTQIRALAHHYMKDPQNIRIKSNTVAVEDVTQLVVLTTDRAKQETLRRFVDEYRPNLAMIFCRTKRRAKTLCTALQDRGYPADELHGDLSQAAREQVIHRFRSGQIRLLVATDVAARGLDVEGVSHVFNYDIPHDVESYIHRIGRTGRAGGKGMAITFVAPKDNPYLTVIEKGLHQQIMRENALYQRLGGATERPLGENPGKQNTSMHRGRSVRSDRTKRPPSDHGGRSRGRKHKPGSR